MMFFNMKEKSSLPVWNYCANMNLLHNGNIPVKIQMMIRKCKH